MGKRTALRGIVALVAGAAVLAFAGGARADGAPVNTLPPFVSGDTSHSGNALSTNDGVWDGSPTSFTYQWNDCSSGSPGVGCAAINGATDSNYTIQAYDLGSYVQVEVSATNAGGTTSAWGGTEFAAGVPRITGSPPSLSGDTTTTGNQLTLSNGDWSGEGTLTFTYDWYSFTGSCPGLIAGATSNTYTTTSDDLGCRIHADVYATNAYGQGASFANTPTIGAPVDTVAPAITGDPGALGNVLTVSDGTWEGSPSLTYQWQRCNSLGFACADIPGETSSTHTIETDDLGNDLQATVTATSAGGSASASSAVVFVPDLRPSIQIPAFITGDHSAAGDVLTVSDGTWSNSPTSITYQWLRCDNTGNNCSNIDGATSNQYTIQAGDLGDVLEATVTATNANGSNSSTTSNPFAAGSPTVQADPEITGDTSAAGNVLTVSDGTWDGSPTFTYQWQQCDANGDFCSDIGGATTNQYTIQAGDLGHVLLAAVTATNAYGGERVPVESVALGVPALLDGEHPTISGDLSTAGSILTVTTGGWANDPTSFSYQWIECNAAGGDCAQIDGATSNEYTIQLGDLGDRLYVDVTATNAHGSADATTRITTVLGMPANTALPVISGDPNAVGSVLSVSDGTWAGSPTLTYQWQRCDENGFSCADISTATSSTYTIVAADHGHFLDAVVTGTNAYGTVDATAAPVFAEVDTPEVTASPAITGDASEAGNVLTVDTGTWTNSPTSFTYQWQRCTDQFANNCAAIDGATTNAYTLTSDDLGFYITVVVSASNADGTGQTEPFPVGQVGAPEIADSDFPVISGDASAAGNILSVSTGTWSGSPTFTFQWEQCDANEDNCADIPGATASTYTIQDGDLGHVLQADVTATNANGATTQSTTTRVVGVPALTGDEIPEITGDESTVGNVLTVSSGTWSGSPTFAYQWERCDENGGNCVDIAGATDETYAIQDDDVGHILDVALTGTNTYGATTTTVVSFTVVGVPEIVDFDYPQISGDTTAVGNVLTVSDGSWSGSPTITYQWERCDASGGNCVDIPGATSNTYTLATADLGHIVDATVTATTAAGHTSVEADTESPVGAPTILDFDDPEISGDTSGAGQVLTVSSGTWSGSPTLTYQWSRCDQNADNCSDIPGATTNTYTIVDADLGHVLEATVTATNAAGQSIDTAVTDPIGAPSVLSYPQITGDETGAGNVLTVSSGTWSGSPTITYQWERCAPDFSGCDPIDGATANTYTTQTADLGNVIAADVTATNANGQHDSFAETEYVIGAPELTGRLDPALAGPINGPGDVLAVSHGAWSGSPTFTYEWDRCDMNDENCTPIGGATTTSYTIQSGDIGHFLEAIVTATNAYGSSQWELDTEYAVGVPQVVGAYPQILGTPAVGQRISVTNGVWSNATSFTYEWDRCDEFFDCTPIAGQTSNHYTITSADAGSFLDAIVTATNANGSSTADAEVLVGAPFNTALPTISGDVSAVGNKLTATNGTWTGSPTSFTRQWWRCDTPTDCNPIDGATGATYTIASADVGNTLFVSVDARNANGVTEADSANTAVVGTGVSQHELTVSVGGGGSGIVTSNPNGIYCGDTCASAFSTGTTIVLTPHASGGSVFTGWSGGGCSGTGGCSIDLDADTTVTATFASKPGAPTIASFTPTSAGARATVTVTGANLTYTTSVTLGGTPAAFTVVSANTITFTVPAGATDGTIAVTTTSGTATSTATFSVTPPPTITSLDVTSGVVGAVVTITGTNLAHVVGVKIGHVLVVPASVSDTSVTFAIPPGATSGTIEVISPAGTAAGPTFTVTG